jgi:DNA-binding response OmpR family regulator
MKLLIIDDNAALVKSIKNHLGDGFIIDTATTGRDGAAKALSISYDVVILDLQLPDCDGATVCAKIRTAKSSTPILILAADHDVQRRIQLLEAGADDFVTKPFNIAELRARLQALLRRAAQPNSSSPILLEVADLVLNVKKRQVHRAGKLITLRRKEFDILEYLIRNRGSTVSRLMILNYAWEADKDGWDNTVNVHIKRLRDKIDRPFSKRLIKTAYGIGYMIDDDS